MNQHFNVNKITPKGDISWYIKWTSSVILLIAMVFTTTNFTPYNLFLHLIGVCGWLTVGMLWHDRALITVNAVASFIFLTGIVNYYIM
tara:strand:- start:10023 stop:10286 length:264 start_codon:yes stop_codon:yes gene_type:complete